MADWVKIQAQLEKLIHNASEVTGKVHANITEGVEQLIKGYGQGGSGNGGIILSAPLLGSGYVVMDGMTLSVVIEEMEET